MARHGTKYSRPEEMFGTLVAIPSPGDPFESGGWAGAELAGPILSVLQVCPVKKVRLIRTVDSGGRAEQCVAVIAARHPRVEVGIVELPVADLEDFGAVREGLSRLCSTLKPDSGTVLLAATAFPHLHGALLAILAEGQCPARMIDVLRSPFPSGRSPIVCTIAYPSSPPGSGAVGMVREPGAVYVHRRTAATEPKHVPPDEQPDADTVAARMGFVGEHPSMRRLLQTVDAVAQHQVPILIQGETGTGKGLCARLVHALSPMRAGPFVAVNCGALPEQLIESQLFGHRQGAFTGATQDQAGKFEQADGGTLFLDEIGELPLPLQPKLLRVLEDGLVEPLGSAQGRSVNVRIIAATNRDLRSAIARKEFREDLYYRLAFAVLPIPSLQDRRSDIPALALQILSRLNASMKSPRALTPSALNRLSRLPWRGNVRDLENVIGRSVLLSSNEKLNAEDLMVDEPIPDIRMDPPKLGKGFDLEAHVGEVRRALVDQALVAANGNQRAAAEMLGISRQAVSRHLKDKRVEDEEAE